MHGAPARFGVRGRTRLRADRVSSRSTNLHPTKEVTIKTKKNTTIKGVRVTKAQAEVYTVLASIKKGLPDHALVPLAQHASGVRLSSSGIRTRRAELAGLGLVENTGRTVTTGSNRQAVVWKAA